MSTKKTYFKLSALASMFSDHINGLKVTKNVPGSTSKPMSKLTKIAKGNGHIVEIVEAEYLEMMNKLSPAEREAALQEQGYAPGEWIGDEIEANRKKKDGGTGGEEDPGS